MTPPPFLVRGPDGRDYAADHVALMAWAAEGRLGEEQLVFVTTAGFWRRAGDLPELQEIYTRRRRPPIPVYVPRTIERPMNATTEHFGDLKDTPRSPRYAGVLVMLVVLVLLIVSLRSTPESASKEVSVPRVPVTEPRVIPQHEAPAQNSSAVGHRLYVNGLEEVAVARTEEAFEKFQSAAAKNDRFGYAELAISDDVFLVRNGTRVIILDYGFLKHRVRILEGARAGVSGYVPREWVQPL